MNVPSRKALHDKKSHNEELHESLLLKKRAAILPIQTRWIENMKLHQLF